MYCLVYAACLVSNEIKLKKKKNFVGYIFVSFVATVVVIKVVRYFLYEFRNQGGKLLTKIIYTNAHQCSIFGHYYRIFTIIV